MSTGALQSWVMKRPEHRFFALAFGIATAIAFGYLLGVAFVYMFGNKAALEVIKTVTIAAIVFAIWKIVLDHAGNIARFVSVGDTANVRRAFIELVVAMIGLGVTAGAGPPAPPSSLVAMSFIQPVSSGSVDMLDDRIVLPVFPNNLDAKEPLKCDASTTNRALQTLANVDDSGKRVLQEIACGLRACSTGPAVRIDVQGFASSQPFDFAESRSCGNSEEMNYVLAEMRRKVVIRILEDDVSKVANCMRGDTHRLLGPLDIERRDDHRWRNSEEMRSHLGWSDNAAKAGGDADRGREILTRRVDIVIRDKGSCGPPAATTLTASSAN